DAATVARWINGLIEFVRAGCADKDRPCGTLPVMSDGERQLLLHDWNASRRAYPDDRTTLDAVTDQVRAGPDRVAIRCGGSEVTSAQLAARIEQIAAALHEHGARSGDRVAILLHRSPDLVATMLAAWRVGAAYVPLDPDVPKKRIAFMLEDAEVRLTVTSRDLIDLAEQPAIASLCLDASLPAVDTAPGTASRSHDSA